MTLRLLIFSVFFTFIMSCEKHQETEKTSTPEFGKQIKKTKNLTLEKAKTLDLSGFGKLVPIEIKNAKENNVFKKYGIEFGGNCYACDLAIFKIEENNFEMMNLCDHNDAQKFKSFSFVKNGKTLKIRTAESTYIFTRIENEAIYQLKIEGQNPDFKNKRISEFYTAENLINKFEEHDCGDFGG